MDSLVGDRALRRFCANADHDVCNWLTRAEGRDRLCVACRHNDTIPNISQPAHLAAWRDIELAKHRLFYSLLRWKLPLKTRAEDPRHGLAFEFLADPPHPSGPRVMTGHDDGVVTIALAEADSAEMEKRRAELAEPYRSLLGHFRHEVGHSLLGHPGSRRREARTMPRRVRDTTRRTTRRRSSATTTQALPQTGRSASYSAYATSHPWEDFAETWAHYLHIVDTLETASAFGQDQAGDQQGAGPFGQAQLDPSVVRLDQSDHRRLGDLCRRHEQRQPRDGRPDLDPFVLAPAVVEKLRFIHGLVRALR